MPAVSPDGSGGILQTRDVYCTNRMFPTRYAVPDLEVTVFVVATLRLPPHIPTYSSVQIMPEP